ncbi:transcriptional regulator, MucR family [Desulfovibrio sp. A2]|nr:transcriptional regulator, MucR family [Desulfovibrio sp. A2]
MDDMLKEALELVKAQASVRTMTAEEMTSMVQSLAKSLAAMSLLGASVSSPAEEPAAQDKSKVIKERSITCLECGKVFKVITKKHLAHHGLDAEEYREKWGYKKGTPLVCKGLQRERRKKMKDMQLWERRRKGANA